MKIAVTSQKVSAAKKTAPSEHQDQPLQEQLTPPQQETTTMVAQEAPPQTSKSYRSAGKGSPLSASSTASGGSSPNTAMVSPQYMLTAPFSLGFSSPLFFPGMNFPADPSTLPLGSPGPKPRPIFPAQARKIAPAPLLQPAPPAPPLPQPQSQLATLNQRKLAGHLASPGSRITLSTSQSSLYSSPLSSPVASSPASPLLAGRKLSTPGHILRKPAESIPTLQRRASLNQLPSSAPPPLDLSAVIVPRRPSLSVPTIPRPSTSDADHTPAVGTLLKVPFSSDKPPLAPMDPTLSLGKKTTFTERFGASAAELASLKKARPDSPLGTPSPQPSPSPLTSPAVRFNLLSQLPPPMIADSAAAGSSSSKSASRRLFTPSDASSPISSKAAKAPRPKFQLSPSPQDLRNANSGPSTPVLVTPTSTAPALTHGDDDVSTSSHVITNLLASFTAVATPHSNSNSASPTDDSLGHVSSLSTSPSSSSPESDFKFDLAGVSINDPSKVTSLCVKKPPLDLHSMDFSFGLTSSPSRHPVNPPSQQQSTDPLNFSFEEETTDLDSLLDFEHKPAPAAEVPVAPAGAAGSVTSKKPKSSPRVRGRRGSKAASSATPLRSWTAEVDLETDTEDENLPEASPAAMHDQDGSRPLSSPVTTPLPSGPTSVTTPTPNSVGVANGSSSLVSPGAAVLASPFSSPACRILPRKYLSTRMMRARAKGPAVPSPEAPSTMLALGSLPGQSPWLAVTATAAPDLAAPTQLVSVVPLSDLPENDLLPEIQNGPGVGTVFPCICRLDLVREKRKFPCTFEGCDKTYKNGNGLRYHMIHGHWDDEPSANKPHKCPFVECKKRYKNANGLRYHLRHAHNGPVVAPAPEPSPPARFSFCTCPPATESRIIEDDRSADLDMDPEMDAASLLICLAPKSSAPAAPTFPGESTPAAAAAPQFSVTPSSAPASSATLGSAPTPTAGSRDRPSSTPKLSAKRRIVFKFAKKIPIPRVSHGEGSVIRKKHRSKSLSAVSILSSLLSPPRPRSLLPAPLREDHMDAIRRYTQLLDDPIVTEEVDHRTIELPEEGPSFRSPEEVAEAEAEQAASLQRQAEHEQQQRDAAMKGDPNVLLHNEVLAEFSSYSQEGDVELITQGNVPSRRHSFHHMPTYGPHLCPDYPLTQAADPELPFYGPSYPPPDFFASMAPVSQEEPPFTSSQQYSSPDFDGFPY